MTHRPFAVGLQLAVLGLVLSTPGLRAQETRADLVDAARNEFAAEARVPLLARAADPGVAPLDTLWATAVYDLAATFLDQGRPDDAALWLRWAARHGTWPLDREWYGPVVVQAYDQAVPPGLTDAPAGGPGVATSWRWPDDLDVGAPGVVEVEAPDPSVPVVVEVEGEGTVPAGESLSLEPGTYELMASAAGYEPTQVTREVLSGVATVIRFDLPPLLPAESETRASNSLVRVRFVQGGQTVCTNGLIARPDGVVLTAFDPIRSGSGLEILRGDDVYPDVSLAAGDADLNLAVLRFPAEGLPVLMSSSETGIDQPVWSVHHSGCGPATSARTRLTAWDPPDRAPVIEPLPADALGAPVVARDGSLLGLVVAPDQVAPIAAATELLNDAVAAVADASDEPQVAGGGGGFPIVWVGAGAAAVGVAALLLGGGGDDGGGGGGGGGDGTGGIVVTFPGGSP